VTVVVHRPRADYGSASLNIRSTRWITRAWEQPIAVSREAAHGVQIP